MDKITVIAKERDTEKVVKEAVFYDERAAIKYADAMMGIGYIVTLRWGMAPQKRKRR